MIELEINLIELFN